MTGTADARRVREKLAAIKPLAAEYYRLTGKPLGATGEVAEYVAAELGLEFAPPRDSRIRGDPPDGSRAAARSDQRPGLRGRCEA